jgi:hypothetical protein
MNELTELDARLTRASRRRQPTDSIADAANHGSPRDRPLNDADVAGILQLELVLRSLGGADSVGSAPTRPPTTIAPSIIRSVATRS